MASVLSAKHFYDEEAAYAFVEARVWPNGPVCPHCGGVDRISKMKGSSTRIGTYKCYQCRKPFTVKVGTVFEASHVKMHLWLQAMFLMASSKKGISANQLHRTLGVTLKTAWFISHRIREAMRAVGMGPMGGEGKIVEADETFIGIKDSRRDTPIHGGGGHKRVVMSLVERGGPLRSVHLGSTKAVEIKGVIAEHVRPETTLHTDGAVYYKFPPVASHETVDHSKGEYVRGDVHVNTLESFYSTFKRGMHGTYQHCGEKHLHRYLAEFDFPYNHRAALGVNDSARAEHALKGIVGKRLTYRTAH